MRSNTRSDYHLTSNQSLRDILWVRPVVSSFWASITIIISIRMTIRINCLTCFRVSMFEVVTHPITGRAKRCLTSLVDWSIRYQCSSKSLQLFEFRESHENYVWHNFPLVPTVLVLIKYNAGHSTDPLTCQAHNCTILLSESRFHDGSVHKRTNKRHDSFIHADPDYLDTIVYIRMRKLEHERDRFWHTHRAMCLFKPRIKALSKKFAQNRSAFLRALSSYSQEKWIQRKGSRNLLYLKT